MIPATHWEDETAWVVPGNEAVDGEAGHDYIHELDRPCDNCHGTGGDGGYAAGIYEFPCELCDGWGRHTFDIEVECPCTLGRSGSMPDCGGAGVLTHRVSVVAGRVLPIYGEDDSSTDIAPCVVIWDDGTATYHENDDQWCYITLPPAAKPGMWAIQLRKADR